MKLASVPEPGTPSSVQFSELAALFFGKFDLFLKKISVQFNRKPLKLSPDKP